MPQMTKSFRSTSISYRFGTFVSDQYLIDVHLKVSALWDQTLNHLLLGSRPVHTVVCRQVVYARAIDKIKNATIWLAEGHDQVNWLA